MVEYSIELAEKYKLSGSNFLDWKFSSEANNNPTILWKSINKYYQPKTIQNQTTYLKRIFSTNLQKNKLEEVLNKLHENTQQLCSLIDDKTVNPSTLPDSVVAMWTIRNLPEDYKTIGELWLKKCEIEKVTPSLKDTIEELHAYIVQTEDDVETEKALMAKRIKNQNKNKAINRCTNNKHNPLAQHQEEDCWKLHPKKQPKNDKPVKALLANSNPPSNCSFVLDSGATTSMVNKREYFQSIEMKKQEIELADGSIIETLGHGTIQLEFKNIIPTFSNTLYIPSLATNIISMVKFLKTHHIIKLLNTDKFEVIDQEMKKVITRSLASGSLNLYYSPKALAISRTSRNLVTLHQAAGHPSLEYFGKMFPNQNIPQLQCIMCSTCKITKVPFSGSFPQANWKLEFLHMDLCGYISPPSVSGAQYVFKILDGFSHFAWIFFLKLKAETKEILKNHILKFKQQSNLKATNIASDNGTEFVNTKLREFFKEHGISHLTTAPYTPEQNPFSERSNQMTINKTRCLLKDSGLDSYFWAEAANTAVYLENLTPSKNINFEVPFKKWFNKAPSLKHLQLFGWTGNIKITHHVKFLPTKFPLLKIGDTSAHHHSFILVPNEMENLPLKENAILNDPNIQSEDEISWENLKNPSIEEPPLIQTQKPSVKGY
ncbi:hypothetical protein O181_076955 [Austropuccinia psidii MF-1]|uniref:Integrase catalytic domain-containing protein n=1 Tax=Austropuccinia psidii MF-1 TaxID=1389203 RepID=A0A9Q3F9T3_9BASI|nr:hypothetical protein [Austropuccinia psidii MF-1]